MTFGQRVGGDIDGLFGLLIDNLVQLLVISALLTGLVGIPAEIVLTQIIPAVGLAVIFGNVFFAAQAWWGSSPAKGIRRTALPYGINTPSVFAYILFVMLPVAQVTGRWEAAWAAGMVACVGSGVIEFFGAFIAGRIRRWTPRAAMLSALAGIALTFISMDFVVRLFTDPLIGLLPLGVLLAGYFGRARMPLRLPAGLVAIVIGTALAWGLTLLRQETGLTWLIHDPANLRDPAAVMANLPGTLVWYLPDLPAAWQTLIDEILRLEWVGYLGIIIPMGLFNLIGSLQNLESAEAAGDRYATLPSLGVNGLGSIFCGVLGGCFPTTIYIGHPGWKAMGAGWAYSLLNAIVIAGICLTGVLTLVEAVIPITAGAAVLLWIGVIIVGQAFRASPARHAGAVAVGLFPAIAGLIVMLAISIYGPGPGAIRLVENTPNPAADGGPAASAPAGGPGSAVTPAEAPAPDAPLATAAEISSDVRLSTLEEHLTRLESEGRDARTWAGFPIHGLLRLERGLLLISMLWAAIAACLTDRRWAHASVWCLIALALSLVGLIHGYAVEGNALYYLIPGLDVPAEALRAPAWDFAAAYAILALFTGIAGARRSTTRQRTRSRDVERELAMPTPFAPAADELDASARPGDQASSLRERMASFVREGDAHFLATTRGGASFDRPLELAPERTDKPPITHSPTGFRSTAETNAPADFDKEPGDAAPSQPKASPENFKGHQRDAITGDDDVRRTRNTDDEHRDRT